jgi:hypothetical protein
MFILDNVFMIMTFAVILFFVFTFLNILTFSKGTFTSFILTLIFFDLFFKMPFKAIQTIYQEKDVIIKAIEKDKKYTIEQKQRMIYVLQKRTRLFIAFYKAGEFSYTELMISFRKWYIKKPFKYQLDFMKLRARSYENKYLTNLKKEFNCIV